MVRTFVALLIPGAWRDYLAQVERDLSAAASGLSWVRPENLHVTLRFLGDLGESGAARAAESVRRAAASASAFRAALGGLGTFPSAKRPRVIWVGLAEGAAGAVSLARSVNDALTRDGFGPPEKPFRPHLTLARVRERARGLEAMLERALPPPPEGDWLDQVTLMKSDLHPAGARYTALAEVRLAKP